MRLFSLLKPVSFHNEIPFKAENPSNVGDMWVAIGISGLLLALLVVTLVIYRKSKWSLGARNFQVGSPKKIAVLSMKRLSPTAAVHIIEYEGKEYFIVEGAKVEALPMHSPEGIQESNR